MTNNINNDSEKVSKIEKMAIDKGIRMTAQRRLIAKIISDSTNHPDVEAIYHKVSKYDKSIGISTVYRTVRIFCDYGVLNKHDFGDGKLRYEEIPDDHHDHIINIQNGEVLEFFDARIEELQEEIANKYGFTIVDHKLELYCIPKITKD